MRLSWGLKSTFTLGFASCTYTIMWQPLPRHCCPISLGPGMNAMGGDLCQILGRSQAQPSAAGCQSICRGLREKLVLRLCNSVIVTQQKLTRTPPNHHFIPICLCSLSVPRFPTQASCPQLHVQPRASPHSWSLSWPLHPAFGETSPCQASALEGSGKL